MDFWTRLDTLLEATEIVIDRPEGSNHPKYPNIEYPLDYGYLAGTSGGDGNEIDIWYGSDNSKNLVAVICTVDSLKNDTEMKLLLGCTNQDIETIDQFHNSGQYMSGLVIKRP